MQYISKPSFIKAFNHMKKAKHLNSTQVAKRCQWSRSYIYQLTSQKSRRQKLTIPTVRRIAIGFGLDAAQTKAWVSTMKPTASTENSYIKQRNQHEKTEHRQAHDVSNHKKSPRDSNYNSYLANIIKNTMANQSMNTQALAKRSHLKENVVSDIINNNANYVSKRDATMIARGLRINSKKLLYDYYRKHIYHQNRNNKPTDQSHQDSHDDQTRMHVSPTMFRVMKNISKLNNSDLLIINMIANRLADTEKKN